MRSHRVSDWLCAARIPSRAPGRWPAVRRPGGRRCGGPSIVARPCRPRLAPARGRRRASRRDDCSSRRRLRATRKSSPGVNSSSLSSHGAQTNGMPQASASNTPDRRDPGQRPRRRPARDMDRTRLRERLGHPKFGNQPREFDAGLGPARAAPSADSARRARVPKGRALDRLEQEFVQFCGALVVAPIADPDQIASCALRAAAAETRVCRRPRAKYKRALAQPRRL